MNNPAMRLPVAVLLAAFLANPVEAVEWSSTEVQVLHGRHFHEPGNLAATGKTTLTLSHASGHAWGGLFLFVDRLRSDSSDARAEEFYGEAYLNPSLGKLLGKDLRTGPVKDIRLTLGVNHGDKSTGAQPLVWLPGITLALDLPGFAFLDLGLLGYLDRGRFNGVPNTCNDETWQVTPAWKYPFRLGRLSMSFEGFVDIIGRHGTCQAQTLAQPQLRLDLGELAGTAPNRFHAGIEYQYWRNKFGVQGLRESFPQLLFTWSF